MVDQFSPFLVRLLEGPQEGESDERFHEDVLRVRSSQIPVLTETAALEAVNDSWEPLVRRWKSRFHDSPLTTFRSVMVTQMTMQRDYTTEISASL